MLSISKKNEKYVPIEEDGSDILSPEVQRLMGINKSRSTGRVIKHGYGDISGVYPDDDRCDADAGQKYIDADRLKGRKLGRRSR